MSDYSIADGVAIIASFVESMPQGPGVYRMLNKRKEVLYVGKAKNLKKRVANYTKPEKLPYRIKRMIAQTVNMAITKTETESESLLLEASEIKRLQPRYNILLKDDKSYPYILITEDGDFARIIKHRGEQKQKGHYFGPFSSAGAVNKAITDIQKAFLLRPCTDSFFASRKRPCMEYEIKRCSAPCVDKISKEEYKELVNQAIDFLSGKSQHVQEQLKERMDAASAAMDYEKAATLRDRIKALNHIQSKQHILPKSHKNTDVIAIYKEKTCACVQVFIFRNGQHMGHNAYFPSHIEDAEEEEILTAFIGQYYQAHSIPKQVLLSHNIADIKQIEEALSKETKISLKTAHSKDDKHLIDIAIRNAEESVKQNILARVKQTKYLQNIASLCHVEQDIKRIEVYDNSHISGTHQVGAMIVAGLLGFDKSAYRLFNIKTESLKPGDDYAMMREVLTRRFKRLLKEYPEYEAEIWPDLVLIDGGPGHISVAKEVFADLGIDNINFVGIAKGPDRNAGREHFYFPNHDSFTLPKNDPSMHYLQNIRDEAHRFAITSHRKKRSKSLTTSILDDIPGIGKTRKKNLLTHFGSADAVKNASVKELMEVSGISKANAQGIFEYFRK